MDAREFIENEMNFIDDLRWSFQAGKNYLCILPDNQGVLLADSEQEIYWNVGLVFKGILTATKKPVLEWAIPVVLESFGVTRDMMRKLQWSESRPQEKDQTLRFQDTTEPSVYFISGPAGSKIKIGWAYSPEKRLRTIQNMSPFPLRILGTIPGGQTKEAELHQQFRHLRSYGEWFEPDQELLDFIAKEAKPHD